MLQTLDECEGLFRLEPSWVSRAFMVPGGRLRLHPDDLYALGIHRGGINERWLSSTTPASNGPEAPADEGLSYVRTSRGRFTLRSAIEEIGSDLLGADVMEREKGWNLLCKFFDNLGPIPHHLHQNDECARRVGRKGKAESYYFPPQYNQKENNFPYTFMGLEPGTEKSQIRQCLADWGKGDNGILFHSKAYRLQPGTGWRINPGILHAPGSLVTYEPQVNSDVYAVFQSAVDGRLMDRNLLINDVPPEFTNDLDYLVGMIDWAANVDPEFGKKNRAFPTPVTPIAESQEAGYQEMWISFGTRFFSAKELTVMPGRTVVIKECAAFGLILTQGYGQIGKLRIETPSVIRYGEMTQDELFVSLAAAKEGLRIENLSLTEPLVILKHFGPGNPDAERLLV